MRGLASSVTRCRSFTSTSLAIRIWPSALAACSASPSPKLPGGPHRRFGAGVLAPMAHVAVLLVPRLPACVPLGGTAWRRGRPIAISSPSSSSAACGTARAGTSSWGLFHGSFLVIRTTGRLDACSRGCRGSARHIPSARCGDGGMGVLPRPPMGRRPLIYLKTMFGFGHGETPPLRLSWYSRAKCALRCLSPVSSVRRRRSMAAREDLQAAQGRVVGVRGRKPRETVALVAVFMAALLWRRRAHITRSSISGSDDAPLHLLLVVAFSVTPRRRSRDAVWR